MRTKLEIKILYEALNNVFVCRQRAVKLSGLRVFHHRIEPRAAVKKTEIGAKVIHLVPMTSSSGRHENIIVIGSLIPSIDHKCIGRKPFARILQVCLLSAAKRQRGWRGAAG